MCDKCYAALLQTTACSAKERCLTETACLQAQSPADLYIAQCQQASRNGRGSGKLDGTGSPALPNSLMLVRCGSSNCLKHDDSDSTCYMHTQAHLPLHR